MKHFAYLTKLAIIGAAAIIVSTVSVKAATYTVKQDGSGNFTSITQGVASVPNGSTLMIYPGTYNEHVDIINKTVNLIGTDRNTCILQYENSNYYKVPLNFSTGTIENLTIKGYRSGGVPVTNTVVATTPNTAPSTQRAPGEPLSQAEIDAYVAYVRGETSSPNPQTLQGNISINQSVAAVTPANASGYAIHLDQDYLFGKSAIIKNCNIISENASCIGMGLRGASSVSISGCNFTSLSQGIIFFHDTANPLISGNASLNFTGNTINSNGSFFIMTTALSPTCNVNLTFNRNVVNGNLNCLIINLYEGAGQGWMGLNNYFLSASSVGNNVAFLNRQ